MQININGVKITLTKEQLAEIDKQINKSKYNHYTDIKTVNDSLDYFNLRPTEELSTIAKIQIVAKAINELIDNKPINSRIAYFPYYKFESSGLVFCGSLYDCYGGFGRVALIKGEEACNYFGKQFIDLYKQLEKEYK